MMENGKRILIVEDEDPLRRLLHKRLARKGDLVDSFGRAEDALAALEKTVYDIALLDIKLPGMDGIDLLKIIKERHHTIEVIIITGHGSLDSAITAMKLGAYDYLTKPCKLSELEIVVNKAYEKRLLQEANINLREEIRRKTNYGQVVGDSKKMKAVMTLVNKVAKSNSTVLITGETGTGKELVAQSLHQQSLRRDQSFIAVHCAALPETLQESELFGYERGAFTGAVKRKRGLVELANQGTLFIDEVGEISPSLQVKILRVIETGHFRHLGGEQELHTDIRVIAATNRDLLNGVKEGSFREDLYYRLRVVTIQLPPLRDRKEDIPLLVNYFLEKTGGNKRLTRNALYELERCDWPGNVRELANVIEVAAMLASGKDIGVEDLPIRANTARQSMMKSLPEMEKEHITQALTLCNGNKRKSSEILGISLRNLYRKIERYNIKLPKA